jgi:hypothetical protein
MTEGERPLSSAPSREPKPTAWKNAEDRCRRGSPSEELGKDANTISRELELVALVVIDF